MGLFKKIFKPVSKVLDKVIPNEIKPALPYLAAFAPVFGPASVQGFIGDTMLRRALTSGALNIGAQLSQEGSEGDINLLSAGLGALSGAMTAPGAADQFQAMKFGERGSGFIQRSPVELGANIPYQSSFVDQSGITGLQKAANIGLEGLRRGSEFLAVDPNVGGTTANLLSKEGLKIAAAPAATATGDLMQAEARRLEKQSIIDAALEEATGLADSAASALAIRNAMQAYGFFSEDEILDTIASAGYKAGGRVGFDSGGGLMDTVVGMFKKEDKGADFGGITEAVEKIEKKPKEVLVDKLKVTIEPGQSEMRAIIEAMYNDVDGVMPDDRKKEFYELYSPQMYKNGEMDKAEYEFIQTEILGKEVPKMAEGGLMNLGGKEMDLRGGGFVPIGKKERADDVPARLSKNEFVMTADAVKAAGGGSVNKGAKRMYDVMNKLEARA